MGGINDIKSAAKGIHGAGEALRGTFNAAVDDVAHDDAGRAKNAAIADKGFQTMSAEDKRFGAGKGVPGSMTTATGSGAHGTTTVGDAATGGAGPRADTSTVDGTTMGMTGSSGGVAGETSRPGVQGEAADRVAGRSGTKFQNDAVKY